MENFFSILGGMGTKATESFVRLVNQRTLAHKDQDYLNYVLFNHATVPDRTAHILDQTAESPVPYLVADIKKQNLLEPNFIVLTCNTAHYFYEELQEQTEIPILHMPREAVAELKRQLPNGGKIAFLGTEGSVKAGVYQKELEDAGFEVFIPDDALQEKVNHLIYHDVKENDFINLPLYEEILKEVYAKGCQQAILGCTELSLVEEFAKDIDYPVIDAQSIIVDKTIELAKKYRNQADTH